MGHHCGRFAAAPLSRREMLTRCGMGFGSLALAAMLGDKAHATAGKLDPSLSAMAPRSPHFAPKARSVIFLYMDGGVSQVDSFDYKPNLEKYHGKDPYQTMGKLEPTQFANVGKVMASPWKFKQRGESGAWVSDLFPHIAQCADDLAIVRSMTADFSEHTNANYFLHTGLGLQGRPSMGAWATYGLGSENQDLPGFIVLNGGLIPVGGLDNFNSGFLPAAYQGSVFRPTAPAVANIQPAEKSSAHQRHKLDLVRSLDQGLASRYGSSDAIESAIVNAELAFRMQSAVPELMDLSKETQATKTLYGLDAAYPQTRIFASECLLARRMVERGVRFIELTCPVTNGDRWDQHGKLKEGHGLNALAVDQPIAALLKDLKQRGLWDSTLVVWSGEFGRTPFAQGGDGRDHNPFGFSLWFAGAGVKGGTVYGETDEWGYKAVVNRCHIHDLHATMLHLMGIDHTRLTFRFSGRDIRLTDVHGEILHDILV